MKRVFAAAAALYLMAATASAQEPRQITPAVAALQAGTLVNQLGELATNQSETIAALQKQLAEAQAKIRSLEDKYEPKPK